MHGIYGVLSLVWNQTRPLFQRPNICNTFKLCYLMFVLFSIGHGTFMWWEQKHVLHNHSSFNQVLSEFFPPKGIRISWRKCKTVTPMKCAHYAVWLVVVLWWQNHTSMGKVPSQTHVFPILSVFKSMLVPINNFIALFNDFLETFHNILNLMRAWPLPILRIVSKIVQIH